MLCVDHVGGSTVDCRVSVVQSLFAVVLNLAGDRQHCIGPCADNGLGMVHLIVIQ